MISFLNSVVLGALALAAIPVLIHLLNRKKAKVIRFSSLTFLKSLQNKRIRRVKLQQWILLALRTLIICLLVLAFARPVSTLFQNGGLASHGSTSIVLVIDNGVLTGYQSEEGVILDRAKSVATRIVNQLKEGDEIALLTTAGLVAGEGFSQNFALCGKFVSEIEPSFEKPSLLQAVYNAVELLGLSTNPNKEIYVVSCLQDGLIPQDVVPVPGNYPLVFINPLDETVRNVAIYSTEVTSRLFEPGKPVEMKIGFRNDAQTEAHAQASVFLENRRVAQLPVVLPASSSTQTTVRFVLPAAGFSKGRVEIDDDALMADNRRFFHFYVSDSIEVGLVGKPRDTDLIALALNPENKPSSRIKVRRINPDRLAVTDFSSLDAFIISNVDLSASDLEKLSSVLKAGKGIILFAGEDSDLPGLNAMLSNWQAGTFSPVRVVESDQSAVIFTNANLLHPILNGLFEKSPAENALDSPVFRKIMGLKVGPAARSIIGVSTGDAFLTETRIGGGVLLLFAVTPDLKSSDFPARGLFAPLMVRSVYYLVSSGAGSGLAADDSHEAMQINVHGVLSPKLRSSEGEVIVPGTRNVNSNTVIDLPPSLVPGNYDIIDDGKMVGIADVNLATASTEPTPITRQRLETVFGRTDLEIIDENHSIESIILQSRYGRDLWGPILILVVTLMLIELLIGQWDRVRDIFKRVIPQA